MRGMDELTPGTSSLFKALEREVDAFPNAFGVYTRKRLHATIGIKRSIRRLLLTI
jgi:hypothetical protein